MNSVSTERNELAHPLVVVVEDELIIREFVCEILKEEGYETVEFETADAAVPFLEQRAPEVGLLLTDILMPGHINGADLSNLVHRRWPQVPILIMSGHETPESSGVMCDVAFLRKPWTIGQMLQGVEDALQQAHARAH
ncbi:response regulator [Pseudomonas sp.]|uniref:response regulator n=1 Tax=Pseudomonas sp. TaxID=306 RepID=UPI003CC5D999